MTTWQPIETAPTLERVMVCCWSPRSGNVSGYWWYYEDITDEKGVPMDHPDASHFLILSEILPNFPDPPQ